ncbi:unnamed protein product [Ilex paraguariensis]|uniref:Uncharacterized protein n=1 Tax=Ilex paraguariensis TaxID=185542 RepID=A0ABC8U432_9AQUA
MEDSTAMTIEFLRARLLSERSVSRTARQRADELAVRVVELEEQLKIVSLQRKKAEKATADVLAILENNGISDDSQAFDSSSDQEADLSESKVGNDSVKEENSVNVKERSNDMEAFSGSEVESSPSSHRSLSWKSGKDSLHSLEKKKQVDFTGRRRSSFASAGSSPPKRAGKSCRQIRRRETRNGSATSSEGFLNCSNGGLQTLREGSQNHKEKDLLEGPVSGDLKTQRLSNGHYFNGHGGHKDMERALEHQAQLIGRYEAEEKAQREWEEKFRETNGCPPWYLVGHACRTFYELLLRHDWNGSATSSEGFLNCSNGGLQTLREGSQNHKEKDLLEGPVSGDLKTQRLSNGHYFNGHGGHKDMERALEHQAQLIGRYEAEEKAQREWEEKFRETNGCPPDSCDLGNHSDVTEERDEIKAPVPKCSAGTITSQNPEAKFGTLDTCDREESKIPNGFQSPPEFDMGCLQDQKCSSAIAYKSTASHMAKGKHDMEYSQNCHSPPLHNSHQYSYLQDTDKNQSAHTFYAGSCLSKAEASGSRNQLALIVPDTSGKLESVLEALQQAKVSLKQELNRLPFVEGGSVGKAIEASIPVMRSGDRLEVPVGCAGLFKLPTDFQFGTTTPANVLGSGSRLSLANYCPETSGDKFFSSPRMESLPRASFDNRFLTIPTNLYSEMRPQVPSQMPIPMFGPSLDAGLPSSGRYTNLNSHLSTGPPSTSNYTYPIHRDLMPRMPSNGGLSRPFPSREVGVPPSTQFSFYDDQLRPNMYR